MAASSYDPSAKKVLCINSWGTLEDIKRVPGERFKIFCYAICIDVDDIIFKSCNTDYWSLLPAVWSQTGLNWFDGFYFKPKTNHRSDRMLRIEGGKVSCKEGGRWIADKNPIIVHKSGSLVFTWGDWTLDMTKTSLRVLHFNRNPGVDTSAGGGVKKDEHDNVFECIRLHDHLFTGFYIKQWSPSYPQREVKIHKRGKGPLEVLFLNEGSWQHMGEIEKSEKTGLYFYREPRGTNQSENKEDGVWELRLSKSSFLGDAKSLFWKHSRRTTKSGDREVVTCAVS